ncbi:MAG: alpha/beta hydrolase [Anaerolineales bacterium]|jgi:pimeloyl-ACP methyl ester carboxylesterase
MDIPFVDFSGNGEDLIFLHANGYPPECYRPLFSRLTESYHVTAMVQRPLWTDSNPEDIEDWHPLTADFLRFLDTHHSIPIACIGHSMGGIALLRAALQEPERFKAIVLLDPVLFPPYFIAFWNIMRQFEFGRRNHPLVEGARRRRREFDDLEELHNRYRCKSVFKYMDDQALHAYIEGITCQKDDGGYQLCYSADWEIRIYLTGIWHDMDIWHGLQDLKVSAIIIRGAETDTFWERTGKLVQRKQPKIKVETLEKATHLLPLEHPGEVSKLIQSFFEVNA